MKLDPVLEEAKRLHALGYAVHWLHPKSKIPIGKKWSSRARQGWEVLEASYEKGMNVGVRLGSESRIDRGSLVVIDFDLKSDDPKHREEMMLALEKYFPGLYEKAPRVASGRGNGSGHLHVATLGNPKSKKIDQSTDVVRVHMPSAWKISKREREELTETEIKAGIRLRAAWEIGVMGEGTQVVLPPSLHPDSGQRYAWARRFQGVGAIPLLEESSKPKETATAAGAAKKLAVPFLPIEVDLKRFALQDDVLLMLSECEDFAGNSDASVLAFKVAIAMVQAGATDQEIASVLTDRSAYALADIGYRHRQTEDPEKAWAWVVDYCLAKARAEFGMSEQFDATCEISPEEEARIAADSATSEELAWTSLLDRNKQTNAALATVKNIRLILQNDVSPRIFRFDQFSSRMSYGADAPWNSKRAGEQVSDIDPINVQSWLATKWGIEPAKTKCADAIEQIASENSFHPVRDYILSLEWDGIPRIDTWLRDYVGAEAREPYLSAISRKVLCAMIARVFVPGIKFDHVLVLEGMQGMGKSSVVNILGGEWTLDATLDLRDKDSVQSMFGRWVVELGELASLRAADLETMKAFISRRTDRIRVSYGRWAQDYDRQCIFIGTTNEEEYLKDFTGERRFWPVRTQAKLYNLDELREDRDQLIAEAYVTWRDYGEKLFLSPEETIGAREEQSERAIENPWQGKVKNILSGPHPIEGRTWDSFTIDEVFRQLGFEYTRSPSIAELKAIGAGLRRLGYTKRRLRRPIENGGLLEYRWEKGNVPRSDGEH